MPKKRPIQRRTWDLLHNKNSSAYSLLFPNSVRSFSGQTALSLYAEWFSLRLQGRTGENIFTKTAQGTLLTLTTGVPAGTNLSL
jgi:hypothetical protein